jgi:DnaJ-class molecular chaperone
VAGDPYEILGVAKTASDAEIKSAYRKLAKTHHPDLNPGKESEHRFREIGAAYALLGDPAQRAKFDRGEIDLDGQPRQQEFYRQHAGGGQGRKYRPQQPHWEQAAGNGPEAGFDGGNFSDFFSQMFSHGREGAARGGVSLDARYTIDIDFMEAALGAAKRVTMPDGRVLDLKIPEGIGDGQQLRLKGHGNKGRDGTVGDAYVQLHVGSHPVFTRNGNDIAMELPVGFHESVLGSKVTVPTIHGSVQMAIPVGSNTGRVLRLKGKGIKGGDQLVSLRIVMPPVIDEELRGAIERWAATHSFDPRDTTARRAS